MDYLCPILEKYVSLLYCYECPFVGDPYYCDIFRLHLLRKDLIIQKDDFDSKSEYGYDFYYPLILILKKNRLIMISTKEVLETLKKQFNISIDRTLLFKYEKKDLLEKGRRTSGGRGKGVKQNWNDETPLKIFYINLMLKSNITLDDIKRFQDLTEIKNLKLLQYYGLDDFRRKAGMAESSETDRVEMAKFHTVVPYLAAVKANIKPPFEYVISSNFSTKDIGYYDIQVAFQKPINKVVIFSQDSVKVTDIK